MASSTRLASACLSTRRNVLRTAWATSAPYFFIRSRQPSASPAMHRATRASSSGFPDTVQVYQTAAGPVPLLNRHRRLRAPDPHDDQPGNRDAEEHEHKGENEAEGFDQDRHALHEMGAAAAEAGRQDAAAFEDRKGDLLVGHAAGD